MYGQFTSSEIWKLTTKDRSGKGFGKPALDYIKEKQYERRLKRRLRNEIKSRETSWGNFIEGRIFNLLGLEYSLESKTRFQHPEFSFWSGAPDLITKDIVGDIKCPFTLKSFVEMYDCDTIEKLKEERPEYYWQLVSNSILTGREKCELIIYCPYESELEEIREEANNYEGNQNDIAFINWAMNDELPNLNNEGEFKNINKFTFIPSQEDKDFLIERIKQAGGLL